MGQKVERSEFQRYWLVTVCSISSVQYVLISDHLFTSAGALLVLGCRYYLKGPQRAILISLCRKNGADHEIYETGSTGALLIVSA
jgi:hypothetical protein